LASTSAFASPSTDTAAMALSPDGKTLATVPSHGSPAIVLWNASTGKQIDSIPWTNNATPGILSWSRDGKHLAAADGSVISVWELPSHDPLWTLNLPSSAAMRVYDVQAGTVTQRPDPAAAFANGTFLQWGANGQVVSAPVGAAGSTGIVSPGAPLVGLWQVSGSHLFLAAEGVVALGVAPSDATHHSALLSWSPDGRYILWGIATQPVAIAASNTGSATATSGRQVVTPTTNASTVAGVPPPDAIVATLASNLGQAGHGDVLLWFSPDGKTLAACDSSSASDALQVFDISSARAIAIVPSGCKGVSSLSAFAWEPSSTAFLLALPGKPVATYRVSPAAS
ncbi:MAG TPA: WD40 repeat domain-containing protein, partial [Ktedonobacterales bacterium]